MKTEVPKKGDIVYTVDGYGFKITTVRMWGYSGAYVDGPHKGEHLFLDYRNFKEKL